jgi:hypothetical protein
VNSSGAAGLAWAPVKTSKASVHARPKAMIHMDSLNRNIPTSWVW